jgi:hypothetical protein
LTVKVVAKRAPVAVVLTSALKGFVQLTGTALPATETVGCRLEVATLTP